GASSVVYRTSPEQVVKCCRPGTLGEIEHERDILERLGEHPLIIKKFEREDAGQLILQYHPRELRDLLLSGTHIHLEKWALQITEALAHVHAHDIIYRNFNLSNIRIQTSQDIVLCDFAGSSLVGHTQMGVRAEVRFCRLPYHSMATVQDDLFSLGSVLYELSTGSVPYATRKDKDVVRLYGIKKFPPVCNLPIGKIITKYWNESYQSANEVLLDLV
ncbi:kinase-like protein, partial [Hyaloscypha bicolor E]